MDEPHKPPTYDDLQRGILLSREAKDLDESINRVISEVDGHGSTEAIFKSMEVKSGLELRLKSVAQAMAYNLEKASFELLKQIRDRTR